jgi:metal-responsive CopG/Arc/MetJ family transcriptional regulator
MARQSVISRKKRGPPPTGKGIPILVRLQPLLLADVDEWIVKPDIPFSRPEAIRRLIESALATKSKRPTDRGEK